MLPQNVPQSGSETKRVLGPGEDPGGSHPEPCSGARRIQHQVEKALGVSEWVSEEWMRRPACICSVLVHWRFGGGLFVRNTVGKVWLKRAECWLGRTQAGTFKLAERPGGPRATSQGQRS